MNYLQKWKLHNSLSKAYLYCKDTGLFWEGRVRVCFLQSRESVCVSLSFLPVSSSCPQLSHHCFCRSVCYMWLFVHPLFMCLCYRRTKNKMCYVNALHFYHIQCMLCIVCVFVDRIKTNTPVHRTRVLSTRKHAADVSFSNSLLSC